MKLVNSFFSKKRSVWGLAACMLFAGTVDAAAQNYVHGTTATLNNAGGAILRLSGNTSQFRNYAPATTNIVNNGVFEVQRNINGDAFADGAGVVGGATALGSTAPLRIPGTVLYSFATTGTQIVQGRYYNNLDLTQAGQKGYGANTVYVAGTYTATGGDRDYGISTFIYDGVLAQTMLGENGTAGSINRYYNLNTQNAGAKTVAGGEDVRVSNAFTMEASNTATLTINGTLRSESQTTQQAGAGTITVDGAAALLNLGSSSATFSATGNVALDNGGTLNTGAGTASFAGTATVNNGTFNVGTGSGLVTIDPTGTLALANAATALLYATTGTQIDVAGTFTNGLAARTNMNFNDLSTVRYTGAGAQTIVSTVVTNPYGNLIVTNASKIAGGDIYVSNNFGAYDNNLPMAANTLFMSDPTASANYGPGIEVVGRMNRTMGSTSAALTFNNNQTIVTMTGGTFPATMTFNVQPVTAPLQYDNTTDVNRKITIDYPTTGWQAQIRAGYKTSDIPGSWAATTNEGNLRFYEADASAAEKMGTGFTYNRNTTATAPAMRYVELANIQATAGTVDAIADGYFASGNDLLLRGGPTTFYTVSNGRWSNPGTWDEGIQPSASDNVVINHTVHVGYRRDPIDGTLANGRIPEDGGLSGTAFVSSNITLANDATISNLAGASLLFGSRTGGSPDEISGSINWSFAGSLTNNRAAATVNPDNTLLTGTYGSSTLYDGLINFATPGTSSLILSGGLTNNGALSNGGLIRVGQ